MKDLKEGYVPASWQEFWYNKYYYKNFCYGVHIEVCVKSV